LEVTTVIGTTVVVEASPPSPTEQCDAVEGCAKAPECPQPRDRSADRINAEHEAVLAADRRALRHAMRAGDLLTEVKSRLGHGRFICWVEAHCRFSIRTAQLYMELARELTGRNTQFVAHLTVTAALDLLRKERIPWKRRSKRKGERRVRIPPVKRLVIRLEFERLVDYRRFWALLGGFHARGDPTGFLLRLLEEHDARRGDGENARRDAR